MKRSRMPELIYWDDHEARQALLEKGRVAFAQIAGQLRDQGGVVAIEPHSGTYFWGPTLGKANDGAYAQYPDRWLYFVRLDDPGSEVILPTW
jgi:hypothetical protein